MEENAKLLPHKMTITNRKTGNFTGVIDVISFDMNEILLETQLGLLHIKGKDLHVNRLNLEKGEIDLDGMMQSLVYEEIKSLKKPNKVGTMKLGKFR